LGVSVNVGVRVCGRDTHQEDMQFVEILAKRGLLSAEGMIFFQREFQRLEDGQKEGGVEATKSSFEEKRRE